MLHVLLIKLNHQLSHGMHWQKHNEKTITKKILDLTNKHILANATIKEMMREKQAYLIIEEEEYIPIQHEIGNWATFLPPLMQLKLPTAKPLSNDFEEKSICKYSDGIARSSRGHKCSARQNYSVFYGNTKKY